MITSGTAAYGMYSRHVALPDVVSELNSAGFTKQDICMVLSPAHPDVAALHDSDAFSCKQSDRTISTRMIDWFSRFGAVVIPTVGLFIRSTVYFQAILSDQSTSSMSLGSRTLLGLGFSQDEAKRLGHRLTDVSALIYVSCKEKDKTSRAIELLRRTGAQEANSLGKMTSAATA